MLRFFRKKPAPLPSELESFLARHGHEIEGSLCVFGDWFGRPRDNWHKVFTSEVKNDILKLTFSEGETLEVWEPRGLQKEDGKFTVQHATRVRWEWFYHGRAQTPENRYFREHVVKDGAIQVTTNVTWQLPDFAPSLAEPAVLMQ